MPQEQEERTLPRDKAFANPQDIPMPKSGTDIFTRTAPPPKVQKHQTSQSYRDFVHATGPYAPFVGSQIGAWVGSPLGIPWRMAGAGFGAALGNMYAQSENDDPMNWGDVWTEGRNNAGMEGIMQGAAKAPHLLEYIPKIGPMIKGARFLHGGGEELDTVGKIRAARQAAREAAQKEPLNPTITHEFEEAPYREPRSSGRSTGSVVEDNDIEYGMGPKRLEAPGAGFEVSPGGEVRPGYHPSPIQGEGLTPRSEMPVGRSTLFGDWGSSAESAMPGLGSKQTSFGNPREPLTGGFPIQGLLDYKTALKNSKFRRGLPGMVGRGALGIVENYSEPDRYQR